MYIFIRTPVLPISVSSVYCVDDTRVFHVSVHDDRRTRGDVPEFLSGEKQREGQKRGIRKRETGLPWETQGLIEGWRGRATARRTDYTHTNRRPLTSRVSQYELKHIKSTYIYWSQYLRAFTLRLLIPKGRRCRLIGDR